MQARIWKRDILGVLPCTIPWFLQWGKSCHQTSSSWQNQIPEQRKQNSWSIQSSQRHQTFSSDAGCQLSVGWFYFWKLFDFDLKFTDDFCFLKQIFCSWTGRWYCRWLLHPHLRWENAQWCWSPEADGRRFAIHSRQAIRPPEHQPLQRFHFNIRACSVDVRPIQLLCGYDWHGNICDRMLL